MRNYTVDFHDITDNDLPLVGGKGLNLGVLAKIPEVAVPAGFCFTAAAFKKSSLRTRKSKERSQASPRALPMILLASAALLGRSQT